MATNANHATTPLPIGSHDGGCRATT
jgi:hypothetical protein